MPLEIEGVKFYNVKEIAELIKVDPQTVRAYIKRGRIKAVRIGRELRITESQFKGFIEELTK